MLSGTGRQVKRAFKYRFYPTDVQAVELARTFAVVVTAAVRALKVPAGEDETGADGCTADAGDRPAAPEDPAGELTGQSA